MIFKQPSAFQKGASLYSVLLAISLFLGIFIALEKWQEQQQQSATTLFLQRQAIQVQYNQKQRRYLDFPCEKQISRNNYTMKITCNGQQENLTVCVKIQETGLIWCG